MSVIFFSVLNLLFIIISNYTFSNIPLFLQELQFSPTVTLACLAIGYIGIPLGVWIFNKFKGKSSQLFIVAILFFANLHAVLRDTKEFLFLVAIIFAFYTVRQIIMSTMKTLYIDTSSFRLDVLSRTCGSILGALLLNFTSILGMKIIFVICSAMIVIHLLTYNKKQKLITRKTDFLRLYTRYQRIINCIVCHMITELWMTQFLTSTLRRMEYNLFEVSLLVIAFMFGQVITHFPFLVLLNSLRGLYKVLFAILFYILSIVFFLQAYDTPYCIISLFCLGGAMNMRYAPREYLDSQLNEEDKDIDINVSLEFLHSFLVLPVLFLQTTLSTFFYTTAMPIGCLVVQILGVLCII